MWLKLILISTYRILLKPSFRRMLKHSAKREWGSVTWKEGETHVNLVVILPGFQNFVKDGLKFRKNKAFLLYNS